MKNTKSNKRLRFFQAKHNFYSRTHMADECKNEYAAQLQNFNAEQWKHFNNAIPHIFKVAHAEPAAGRLCTGGAADRILTGCQV